MSVRYRMRRWYDHYLVMIIARGSVFPRAMLSIVFSMLLCVLYWELGVRGDSDHRGEGGGGLMGSPQVYGYFMQCAALVLAFTTSISYNRFWEALGHLTQMTNAMSQAASCVLAFDECGQDNSKTSYEAPLRWRAVTLHYFSILHAVCCQMLFSADGVDAKLDILGGLTTQEQLELSAVTDQAALCFHWINERMSQRVMTGGLQVPPPICSQLWTQLSNAMTSYSNAVKILDTPLPLPYQQCLAWSDIIVMFLTPFCICSYVESLGTALSFTFCIAWLFHGIYLADVTMQQPFGNRSNDLPMVERHKDFIDRLVSFVSLDLANEINHLYEHSDSSCHMTLTAPTPQFMQTTNGPPTMRPVSFRAIEVIPRRHSEDCGKACRARVEGGIPESEPGRHISFDRLPPSVDQSTKEESVVTTVPPTTGGLRPLDDGQQFSGSLGNYVPTLGSVQMHFASQNDLGPTILEPSPVKQVLTHRSLIRPGFDPPQGGPLAQSVPAVVMSPSRPGLSRSSLMKHHHSSYQQSNSEPVGALFLGDKILAKEYIMPANKNASHHHVPPSSSPQHWALSVGGGNRSFQHAASKRQHTNLLTKSGLSRSPPQRRSSDEAANETAA